MSEIRHTYTNLNGSKHANIIHVIKIWAASWQNQQNDCAPSEDSDQPGHPPRLIKVFDGRMKKAWVLSYLLSGQRRLIRLGRYPGWSESSLGAEPLCWFCHEMAHMLFYPSILIPSIHPSILCQNILVPIVLVPKCLGVFRGLVPIVFMLKRMCNTATNNVQNYQPHLVATES